MIYTKSSTSTEKNFSKFANDIMKIIKHTYDFILNLSPWGKKTYYFGFQVK